MSVLKIDIVSDVVCPWCIVGYKQLEIALAQSGTDAQVHWHPFELNPDMPSEGQDLVEHVGQKYGSTAAQSEETRRRFVDIGESIGFSFNYAPDSRIVNTFEAHQLLHWTGLHSLDAEHRLKMALFKAYFSDQKDVSDSAVLIATVAELGLDASEAESVLQDSRFAQDVRDRERRWTSQGVSGVPAMVFNDQYLVTGAQGIDNYLAVIDQVNELPAKQ